MKTKTTVSQKMIVWSVAAAVVALSATLSAAEHEKPKTDLSKIPPASTKKDVTYAGDIKAIFDKSCVKCHGEERPKAHLQLTSLEKALKGKGKKDGTTEKVIEPGKGVESELLVSVAHANDDEDTWMPPLKNKAKIDPLTKEQVGLIRAWIDQGAK